MRISRIDLSWFRGAGDSVTLETRDRSISVYGDNGAGKSCFVDAIEYVLRGGRVEHLRHEYSGRNQEKAILNTHRPDSEAARISITLADGARTDVAIAPSGASVFEEEGDSTLRILDCARTVLRQDEVSKFIHSTKGEKYSVLLPLLGLGSLEVAAENFRQLAKSVRKQSGISEAAVAVKSARARFEGVVDDAGPDSAETAILELCKKFVSEPHDHSWEHCAAEAERAIDGRLEDTSALERQQAAVERLAKIELGAAIDEFRAVTSDLAQVADRAVQSRLAVLEATRSHLGNDDQDSAIACPSCGREIEKAELCEHVRKEISSLEEVKAKSEMYREHLRRVLAFAGRVVTVCQSDDIERWIVGASDPRIEPVVRAAADFSVPQDTLTEEQLAELQDVLGEAISAAVAAAAFHPPAATELARAKERLSEARTLVEAEQGLEAVRAAGELADQISQVEADIREEIRSQSTDIIEEISGDVQRMWSILHPGEPIEQVRLEVPQDSDKAIDIALKFHGKDLSSPRLTLSEGNRNSLGLCVFLAMAARYEVGAAPIVLDDVIVSLDRGHRGMVVDLLEAEFSDRQVLLFTHDRDWHAELRQHLDGSAWTFRSLLPFRTPTEGIRWSDRTGTLDDARVHLESRPDTAANEARKAVDVELAMHVERLGLPLPFARGARNDHRTAHDFLQALVSHGKKKFQVQVDGSYEANLEAIDAFKAADKLLMTWANRGSHSEDVTAGEAERLIDVCSTALGQLTCTSCSKPVSFATTRRGHHQCNCGILRWK